jgi:hypothetical protein
VPVRDEEDEEGEGAEQVGPDVQGLVVALDSGVEWTVDSGQWTEDSDSDTGQWTVEWIVESGVDSGQCPVDSGQWTVNSGQ